MRFLDPFPSEEFDNKEPFVMLVVGGGPAGSSAAIYAARKGIRTGMVVETFAEVMETVGIGKYDWYSFIQKDQADGASRRTCQKYPIDIMKNQRVKNIEKKDLD